MEWCRWSTALQQLFPYKLIFLKNSNRHKILFFHARGIKRGHFDIVDDMIFPILAFFKL